MKIKNLYIYKENEISLRKVLLQTLILFSFLCILFYIIIPLIPRIEFILQRNTITQDKIPVSYSTNLNSPISYPQNTDKNENQNYLEIPSLFIKTEIIEGDDLTVLNYKEGALREKESSNPETLGNMVIAGHRFQYLPPNTNTFYNLDQISLGENIFVNWKGINYWYKVYEILEVNPDQVEVRKSNSKYEREITLYTCTPIHTSEKRLVVKAFMFARF